MQSSVRLHVGTEVFQLNAWSQIIAKSREIVNYSQFDEFDWF